VVTGLVAVSQTARGRQNGRIMAVAGIGLAVVLAVAFFVTLVTSD
jgi:high-affinity Fe2+/Pb2+ permease